MYLEFIAIYVGLGVLAVLLIAVLILMIVLLKKMNQPQNFGARQMTGAYESAGTIVFCKRCGAKFEAAQRVCPQCGTLR